MSIQTPTGENVTIVQLYPEELGVAGDRGNVMALQKRLDGAGIDATVVEHRVGDTLPDMIDLVIVGNGPLSAMRNVYDDLVANAERLTTFHNAGVPIFAYGSGAELLGRSITLREEGAAPMIGLGIFPFAATRQRQRKVGYVVADTEWGQIVGFEDNASLWQLDAAATPFGALRSGQGNGDASTEGVRFGNSIATQIGGPVLPLNPALTDALITMIVARRGLTAETIAETDTATMYAERARAVILTHAKHVFSRI